MTVVVHLVFELFAGAKIATVAALFAAVAAYGVALVLLGGVTVGLGVLLVCNPFEAVNTAIMLIGIFLVYDGISDLWIISRVSKTARNIRQTMEALDVEVEIEE